MANSLVLVHSPLVGPESWEPVGAVLAERGQNVQVADLTHALGFGPPYLPRMVEAIAALDSGPAFLVGHSRAGPLLPALGRAVGSVQGYIFVDTRLPHPGRSWMQAASPETLERLRAMEDDGWVAPWPAWWGDAGWLSSCPTRMSGSASSPAVRGFPWRSSRRSTPLCLDGPMPGARIYS